jgi:hypothetical protein
MTTRKRLRRYEAECEHDGSSSPHTESKRLHRADGDIMFTATALTILEEIEKCSILPKCSSIKSKSSCESTTSSNSDIFEMDVDNKLQKVCDSVQHIKIKG